MPEIRELPEFADWRDEQIAAGKVKYSLVVEVDDVVVFSSDYADIEDLYGEGRKPERSVEYALQEMYNDEYAEELEADV